jgi:alcohol dehydrogenase (cytochrome c)
VVAALLVASIAAGAAIGQVRWRVEVIALHLQGKIPNIELGEVLAYMLPGSEQSMAFLIERRNPYAVIQNYKTSAADVQAGSQLFLARCASCHGTDAHGGAQAPSLVGRELKHGDSDWAVYRTIRDGVPDTAMVATPDLTETQRWQLLSFVRSMNGSASSAAAAPPLQSAFVKVPFDEMAAKREPDADWLSYSGSYTGTRHSKLDQLDRSNVHRLTLKWARQFEGDPRLEPTPLVRNGVMFLSVPPCIVTALDAATGQTLWKWQCEILIHRGYGNNRGVALLDDKVFYAASDTRVFALDAATGKQLWVAPVEEDIQTYLITGAPLAFRDIVVTGTSTRDVGRAVLAAFDARTGAERWRFQAVPGPGEAGNETWAGQSWRAGGGPTWLQGSYDADEDLLYWGVGNPKPDYDPAVRAGDNLYTNSVVVLHGATGKLAWHFQFVPADNRDWGANQIPVLVDRARDGGLDKQLLWANRNGFYYNFDRVSGKFLHATPFVRVTWTPGLDEKGRPLALPAPVGDDGRLLYPGNGGGTHWWSPTYYPERDLMIVPVLEQGMVYFNSSTPPRENGQPFYTAVRALAAQSGDLVWEYRRPPRLVDNFMPGLVSTAGGLVFGGDQSTFFALDAENGELLWSVDTGGNIVASPMTYSIGGQQFVSIAAGGDLLTFGLPDQHDATLPSGTDD